MCEKSAYLISGRKCGLESRNAPETDSAVPALWCSVSISIPTGLLSRQNARFHAFLSAVTSAAANVVFFPPQWSKDKACTLLRALGVGVCVCVLDWRVKWDYRVSQLDHICFSEDSHNMAPIYNVRQSVRLHSEFHILFAKNIVGIPSVFLLPGTVNQERSNIMSKR